MPCQDLLVTVKVQAYKGWKTNRQGLALDTKTPSWSQNPPHDFCHTSGASASRAGNARPGRRTSWNILDGAALSGDAELFGEPATPVSRRARVDGQSFSIYTERVIAAMI
jgi:hypothetical protein